MQKLSTKTKNAEAYHIVAQTTLSAASKACKRSFPDKYVTMRKSCHGQRLLHGIKVYGTSLSRVYLEWI